MTEETEGGLSLAVLPQQATIFVVMKLVVKRRFLYIEESACLYYRFSHFGRHEDILVSFRV